MVVVYSEYVVFGVDCHTPSLNEYLIKPLPYCLIYVILVYYLHFLLSTAGVPGGLVGYPRATCTEINFASSIITECTISKGLFSFIKKMTSGKRESVCWQHSMKIDEQWEC